MKKMRSTPSIKDQVIEAVITHPNETFKIKDIKDQFPDFNLHTLQVLISRDLKNWGYIEKVSESRGTKSQIYKVLKRETSPNEKLPTKPETKPETKPVEKPTEQLDMAQVGESIYVYIQKLKNKIQELSQSYSDLQSELNKEKNANKTIINSKDKMIKELGFQIEVLKSANRRMSGKTFNLGEVANFK